MVAHHPPSGAWGFKQGKASCAVACSRAVDVDATCIHRMCCVDRCITAARRLGAAAAAAVQTGTALQSTTTTQT